MGTELISQDIDLPKYIWSAQTNLDNPSLIYKIHKKYIDSGADYITTNTFRTTVRSYLKTGLSTDEARSIAYGSFSNAIKMANKAAEKSKTKILGSIAPLEDCYTPSLYPGDDIAETEFSELANWFKDSGIDIFILETMNNLPEIISCLNILSSQNIPIWVSLNLLDEKCILSGEKIGVVTKSISKFNVSALLFNCNSVKKTNLAIDNMKQYWDKEWGIYPNLGLGEPSSTGLISDYSDTNDFIKLSKKAVNLGATILGGCCGSDPRHISSLTKKFSSK